MHAQFRTVGAATPRARPLAVPAGRDFQEAARAMLARDPEAVAVESEAEIWASDAETAEELRRQLMADLHRLLQQRLQEMAEARAAQARAAAAKAVEPDALPLPLAAAVPANPAGGP